MHCNKTLVDCDFLKIIGRDAIYILVIYRKIFFIGSVLGPGFSSISPHSIKSEKLEREFPVVFIVGLVRSMMNAFLTKKKTSERVC